MGLEAQPEGLCLVQVADRNGRPIFWVDLLSESRLRCCASGALRSDLLNKTVLSPHNREFESYLGSGAEETGLDRTGGPTLTVRTEK